MSFHSPEISFDHPSVADKLPKDNVKIFQGQWEPKKYFAIRKINRSPSLRSPDVRKRRTIELSMRLKRKYEVSKQFSNSKRKTSVLSTMLPSFSIIFRILKYFKKWTYYRSYTNLQAHHLHIINDQAIILPKQTDTEITYSSIWRPLKANEKNRLSLVDNFIYQGIARFIAKLQRSSFIKETIEKVNKCLNTLPLFDPNHLFKMMWDLFVFLTLFIKVIAYSVDRCFDLSYFDSNKIYLYFSTVHILLMIVDILFTINTKIYVSGASVENRKAILWNYIKRYFFIDFPAISGLILSLNQLDKYELREVNLFLVLKIFFCNPELAKRIRSALVKTGSTSEAVYDLLSLGSSILLSGHIIACLWHFISYNFNIHHPDENCWLKERGILMNDWKIKYLHSIYWSVTTMLTVGYGDITPKNENEILFNTWAMLFGCIIFGYSLNRIGEILRRRSELANINKEKANLLHMMARGMNLSSDLETKITKYMEYFWEVEKKVNPVHETLIMSQLSSNLRDQVYYETNVKYLSSIPIFNKSFSDKILFELAYKLKKIRFPPEEYIYKPGYQGDSSLFIVLDGRVDVITNQNNKRGDTTWEIYKKNEYFGISELFTNFPRRSGAIATEFLTCFQLTREDFLAVISKYSEEYERFCKIKDDLVLYQNQYAFNLKCSSCGRVDHRTFDCPFINYNRNKHSIIGKYLHRKKMQFKRFRRKGVRTKNTLLELSVVNDDAKDLLEDLADDEEIKNYLAQINYENVNQEHEQMAMIDTDSLQGTRPLKIDEEKFENSSFGYEEKPSLKITLVKMRSNNELTIPQQHSSPRAKNNFHNYIRTNSKQEKPGESFDKIKSFKCYYPKSNSEIIFQKLQQSKMTTLKTLNKIISDQFGS